MDKAKRGSLRNYDRLWGVIHWLIIALILIFIQFPHGKPYLSKVWIYRFVLAGMAFNLFYHYLFPKRLIGRFKIFLGSLIDVTAITFLLWPTEAHASPLIFFYFLIIVGVALSLGVGAAFLITAFTSAGYLTIFFLEYQYGTIAPKLPNHLAHAGIIIFSFWLVAYFSENLADMAEKALAEQATLARKNKELYEKERKRRQELAAIQEGSTAILSTLNLGEILKSLAENIAHGLGFDRAIIFLLDKKERVLEGKYISGLSSKHKKKLKIPFSPTTSSFSPQKILFDTIWQTKPFSLEKVPLFKEAQGWWLAPSKAGPKNPSLNFPLATVPIVSRKGQEICGKTLHCLNKECPFYEKSPSLKKANSLRKTPISLAERVNSALECSLFKVYGAIAVDNFQSQKPIRRDDTAALKIFAQNAAIAIENASLYEAQRKKTEEISALNKISRVLGLSLKLEKIYEGLVLELKKVIDFDRVSISLLDESGKNVETYALTSEGKVVERKVVKPKEVCCAVWVAAHKKPLLRNDLTKEPRFLDDKIVLSQGIKTCFSLPLMIKDEVIGTFCLYHKKKAAYSEEDLEILRPLAEQLALAAENATLYERVQIQAVTDSLTKLYNHGYFQKFLSRELARAKRYNKVLTAVMLDIDNFKNYNDTYGHPEGDKVLKRVAKILEENIRDIDIAARYGGDEFTLVLPETDQKGAEIVAKRIEKQVAQEEFPGRDGKTTHLTVSIGVASYPQMAQTQEALIRLADDFLYGRKRRKLQEVF